MDFICLLCFAVKLREDYGSSGLGPEKGDCILKSNFDERRSTHSSVLSEVIDRNIPLASC